MSISEVTGKSAELSMPQHRASLKAVNNSRVNNTNQMRQGHMRESCWLILKKKKKNCISYKPPSSLILTMC